MEQEQATAVPPTDIPQAMEPPPPEPTDTAEPPTPRPTPDRPFTYASHYGGGPAGAWDRANWNAFIENYPDLQTKIIPTDYYSSFINTIIFKQLEDETPPDVFSAAMGGHLYDYVEQGVIADNSDLWQEEGWDEVRSMKMACAW